MSKISNGEGIRPGKRASESTPRLLSNKAIEKSTRISHACELCREKRARCTGERPTCQRCIKLGVECKYGLAKNDKRRKEIDDLQSRITGYESLLNSLASSLDDDARERISSAMRADSIRSDSPTRSEYYSSSVVYAGGSGASSLRLRSPPETMQTTDSGSSPSESVAISHHPKPVQLSVSHTVASNQPASYSSQDQYLAKHRQQNNSSSTQSLTSPAIQWSKGFIYTSTEVVLPPRDVTERAVYAFFVGSATLFEFFDREEMDHIFHTVYETLPSRERNAAVCQLCIAAAVGCQYDWDQFPDDTGKSYLAVAKLYVEDVIESHVLSAMRVMGLLGLYSTFEKRVSSLIYLESGLSIARSHKVDVMIPTTQTMKWKQIWCSLIFLSNWISATISYSTEQVNQTVHPLMLTFGTSSNSMAEVAQLEVCKVALLTGRILRDVFHAPSVDTNVVNMYKAELESWLIGLPSFMRIDSLLANGSNGMPMRPIFLVHLLYLTTMTLSYRRIISEFVVRPESMISIKIMENLKRHLDACLWTSRQVSRIVSVAILNGAVPRKCWMFIHATYCANNILLYFAANKLLQNPESDSVADDIMASEQCIQHLEYCAVADKNALQFIKHVKPLHIALAQIHQVSRTTAPRDVIPISDLIKEYLEAQRPNIAVGDDLAQMQRTVVSAIETLLKPPELRDRTQPRSPNSRRDSTSSYPNPETGMPVMFQLGAGDISAADGLQKYFWDDSLGSQHSNGDH